MPHRPVTLGKEYDDESEANITSARRSVEDQDADCGKPPEQPAISDCEVAQDRGSLPFRTRLTRGQPNCGDGRDEGNAEASLSVRHDRADACRAGPCEDVCFGSEEILGGGKK